MPKTSEGAHAGHTEKLGTKLSVYPTETLNAQMYGRKGALTNLLKHYVIRSFSNHFHTTGNMSAIYLIICIVDKNRKVILQVATTDFDVIVKNLSAKITPTTRRQLRVFSQFRFQCFHRGFVRKCFMLHY